MSINVDQAIGAAEESRPILTAFGFLFGTMMPAVAERLSGEPGEYQGRPLYHYTSAAGLKGIVENRTIWATDATYANDTLESKYGWDMVRAALDCAENRNEKTRAFLNELRDGPPVAANFVACLSTDGDLLSQWRGYGDSGLGYAIGIDTSAGAPTNAHVVKVAYDEAEQRSRVWALSRELVGVCDHLFRAHSTNEDAKAAREMIPALALMLHFEALGFKHCAFEEEREWRYVVADPKLNPTSYRASGGLLVPYQELTFTDGIVPLSEIVVGPSQDFTRAEKALRGFLESYGYDDSTTPMPRIRHSECPYRRN